MTVRLDLNASVAESSTRRALLDISLAVVKCRKIVVVTGAGISCSSGIPDFRSSDGLYALVKQKHPDVVLKGRELFDASLFRDKASTAAFYTFVSQLKQRIDSATPTPTHRFIKTLDTKHRLLRSYTQNIDGFEDKVGLRGISSQESGPRRGKSRPKTGEVRNVQLHGDIHRVRCMLCSQELPCTEDYLDTFDQGVAPDCPECKLRSEARLARSARSLKVGTLRPAIMLYDEVHPLGDEIGRIQTQDIARKPDMLIIMGTSLKVHGLKKLVKDFAKVVHASNTSTMGTPRSVKSWQGKVVFVNKTPPGSEWENVIDYHISCEADCWVEKVLEDWRKMRPSDWEVQQTLNVDGVFKVVKGSASVVEQKKTASCRRKSFGGNVRGDETARPIIPTSNTLSAPASPAKRRQSSCHYSDVESSPRKRKGLSKAAGCSDESKQRPVFLDTTNSISQPNSTCDAQLSRTIQPRVRTSAKGLSVKRPGTKSNHRRSSMWVEIKKTA